MKFFLRKIESLFEATRFVLTELKAFKYPLHTLFTFSHWLALLCVGLHAWFCLCFSPILRVADALSGLVHMITAVEEVLLTGSYIRTNRCRKSKKADLWFRRCRSPVKIYCYRGKPTHIFLHFSTIRVGLAIRPICHWQIRTPDASKTRPSATYSNTGWAKSPRPPL